MFAQTFGIIENVVHTVEITVILSLENDCVDFLTFDLVMILDHEFPTFLWDAILYKGVGYTSHKYKDIGCYKIIKKEFNYHHLL